MKKTHQTIYRVECNRGSKYFSSLTKATKYFDRMASRDFEVELWASTYCTTVLEGFSVSGKQVLLKCSPSAMERYL